TWGSGTPPARPASPSSAGSSRPTGSASPAKPRRSEGGPGAGLWQHPQLLALPPSAIPLPGGPVMTRVAALTRPLRRYLTRQLDRLNAALSDLAARLRAAAATRVADNVAAVVREPVEEALAGPTASHPPPRPTHHDPTPPPPAPDHRT